MGQHKSYEKERSWVQLLLCFVGGMLVVAACLYSIVYDPPAGIIPAHGIGKGLGFGVILIAAPIWAYFRKRKRRPRNSAR